MDGNALGQGLGAGLKSLWDAYAWMQGMKADKQKEADRYAWLAQQEQARSAREQENLKLRGTQAQDDALLQSMLNEDRERAKVADQRAVKAAEDAQRETLDQKDARELRQYEAKHKIDAQYRPTAAPKAPAPVTRKQKAAAGYTMKKRLAGLEDLFKGKVKEQGSWTPDLTADLEGRKQDEYDNYYGSLNVDPPLSIGGSAFAPPTGSGTASAGQPPASASPITPPVTAPPPTQGRAMTSARAAEIIQQTAGRPATPNEIAQFLKKYPMER